MKVEKLNGVLKGIPSFLYPYNIVWALLCESGSNNKYSSIHAPIYTQIVNTLDSFFFFSIIAFIGIIVGVRVMWSISPHCSHAHSCEIS